MPIRKILALFFISATSYCQDPDSIKFYLDKGQYSALLNYIKSQHVSYDISSPHAGSERYLREGVIDRQIISKFFEITLRYKVPGGFYFFFNIITNSDKIIFYKFIDTSRIPHSSFSLQTTKPSSDLQEYLDTICYLDTNQFQILQRKYRKVYSYNLGLGDFFKEEPICYCHTGGGISGGRNPTFLSIELNEMVESKNISKLNDWLSSPITELQLFAIEGINKLKNTGYSPTKRQQKMIKNIRKKKGKVYVGRFGARRSVQEVIKENNL